MRERRIKMLAIGHKDFLELLYLLNGENIVSANMDMIPCDSKILSVFEDAFTDCFMAKIYHESFDIVEEGCVPPTMKFIMDTVVREVAASANA